MIVPGSANALLLRSARGYQINQSLRFRASNSAHLTRTPASATNRRTFTFSAWIKIGTLGTNRRLFGVFGGSTDSDFFSFFLNSSDQFVVGGGITTWLSTTAVFRDPSAWYHILLVVNTINAIANDRVLLWVNGVARGNYPANPALNFDTAINTAAQHAISGASLFFDGYMAEVNFIDGQALTPSSFGQTDTTTGAWVPRRYTGTYGTNGFYLPFNDATSTTTISQDRSGNGNNWTSSGISVTAGSTFDQMLDSPTNGAAGTRPVGNYCVISPITRNGTNLTLSEANLCLSQSAAADDSVIGSIGVSSGKYYWEVTVGAAPNSFTGVGVANNSFDPTQYVGATANGWAYTGDGNKRNSGSASAYGATYTTNDVIGMALDMDAGTLVFYKNNVSQGTAYSGLSGTLFPAFGINNSATNQFYANFGQRAFDYTPPTGFVALNTANLPTPTIQRGDDAMQATLRTGTGASASVSSLRFQPDLVWIKSRSNATNHNLFDAVRGVNNGLVSNSGAAEYADANSLTAFNSNGYTLGTDGSSRGVNINTNTYVDWAWREGAAYGFDIVTYVGNGANRTIAHGLNATPHFMIFKHRTNGGYNWITYHRNQNATPQNGFMKLNLTDAYAADSTMFNNTAPTSSVFSLGTAVNVNENLANHIAYLFTSISGFSLFGSYQGNGSSDGPFVWCGFRPRWVLIKQADAARDWIVYDAARNTFNALNLSLFPNLSLAEQTETNNVPDFLSNGFKVRGTGNAINVSGGTYIFAAFAETPFKTATAR